jgi:hypothetical protein
MDFIERIFGFSPDGGSGLFELLLFLIPLLGLVALWRLRSSMALNRRQDKNKDSGS